MTFTLEPPRTRTRTEQVEPEPQVRPAAAGELLTWPVEAGSTPVIRPPALPEPPKQRVKTVLSLRTTRRVAWISFLAFWAPVLVAPAPNGTQPVMAWWASALDYTSLVLVAGSWLLLAVGRRSGLTASVAGSIVGLGLTASCPLNNHHEIAAWWWLQLAAGVGVLAVSAVLLRRTKRA